MVKVYALDGYNSCVPPCQAPSGPVLPVTGVPRSSTSLTVRTVPEDALTVSGALGRTPVARFAGDTSRTAGVGVWGGRVTPGVVCSGPDDLPGPLWDPVPAQAPSSRLTAISAVARTEPRRNPGFCVNKYTTIPRAPECPTPDCQADTPADTTAKLRGAAPSTITSASPRATDTSVTSTS